MTAKVTSKRVVGVITTAGGSENDDHPLVPTDIPYTQSSNDNIITITYSIESPEIPRRELVVAEIGLPATPDQNSTVFANGSIIDDGYYSNRYLVPP